MTDGIVPLNEIRPESCNPGQLQVSKIIPHSVANVILVGTPLLLPKLDSDIYIEITINTLPKLGRYSCIFTKCHGKLYVDNIFICEVAIDLKHVPIEYPP
jgi:hypothetical protein